MIFDRVQHLDFYIPFNSHIREVSNFFHSKQYEALPNGKHLISDEVFLLIMECDTKAEEDALWEAHRKYIDVQIILSGEEKIAYSDITNLIASNEYSEKDDYQLFKGKAKNYFTLSEGQFALFAPQDAHMTSIRIGQLSKVKKLVFKIPVK
jgi:YhcH/YjgK/YiaL family protein